MATDHAGLVLAERECTVREGRSTVRDDAAVVPAPEGDVTAEAPDRRRSARLVRGGISLLTLAAFVVLGLGRRTALTRSLGRIDHPQWSWIALGVGLEASSMATCAMMQRLLL